MKKWFRMRYMGSVFLHCLLFIIHLLTRLWIYYSLVLCGFIFFFFFSLILCKKASIHNPLLSFPFIFQFLFFVFPLIDWFFLFCFVLFCFVLFALLWYGIDLTSEEHPYIPEAMMTFTFVVKWYGNNNNTECKKKNK